MLKNLSEDVSLILSIISTDSGFTWMIQIELQSVWQSKGKDGDDRR